MKKLFLTKQNKFLRFTNIFVFMLLFATFFSVTFAYWYSINISGGTENKSSGLNIGFWEIKTYVNADEAVGVIPKGTIVVKDGIYYVSLMDILENDPYRDPNVKPTSKHIPMRYCESTREYRWFHRYTKNDIVTLNGRIYRWKHFFNRDHVPNTPTQKAPGDTRYWQDLGPINTLTYSRYKIYPKYSFVCLYGTPLFNIENFYCAINMTNNVNIDKNPALFENNIFWKKVILFNDMMIYPKDSIVYNNSGDLDTRGVFISKVRVPANKNLNDTNYWFRIGDFPNEFN